MSPTPIFLSSRATASESSEKQCLHVFFENRRALLSRRRASSGTRVFIQRCATVPYPSRATASESSEKQCLRVFLPQSKSTAFPKTGKQWHKMQNPIARHPHVDQLKEVCV